MTIEEALSAYLLAHASGAALPEGRRRRGQRGGYLRYRRVRRIQRAVQGADGAPGCRGVVPAVTDTISYKLAGADELGEIPAKLGNLAAPALCDVAMAGGKVIADEANRLAPGPGIPVEPEEVGP